MEAPKNSRTPILIGLVVVVALVLGGILLWQLQMQSAAQPAAEPAAFPLTILHTNDAHAHYTEYHNDGSTCSDGKDCLGGVARLKTLVDQERAAANGSAILVDAGDQFQGSLHYYLFKDQIVADTMNALGYQAMAIGNHEFDDGPALLGSLAGKLKFPILGANLDVSKEPSLAGKLADSTVLTVNGEKIGLIGLTTPDTASLSKPGATVVFNDPVTSAQAAVDALQAQGVNKIVALTHLGYSVDTDLATRVKGIDVIIGGHSHTFIYQPTDPIQFQNPPYGKYGPLTPAGPYPTVMKDPNGDTVVVTTANYWDTLLGKLQVTFDSQGKLSSFSGNPLYLGGAVAVDPEMAALMAPYDQKVSEMSGTVIGSTAIDLPLTVNDVLVCREGECLLGDLVADALLWKANDILSQSPETAQSGSSAAPGTPFEVAIMNAGSLRAGLSGQISIGNVLEVLPYGNTIATFELKGADLLSALESGVSLYHAESGTGRFPQVAGIRFSFDPNQPVGQRVSNVEVKTAGGYVPLDPAKVYRIVTNDYLRGGGDGYTIFKDNAINPYDFGPDLASSVQDYIKLLGTITEQNLAAGRIVTK